jgi:anti-sigma factor RsiW
MTNSNMTCDAFDAALPDYLEGTLDDSPRASVEMHLRECVRCAGLIRDIENIRKEAAALPDLVPVRDLWEGIDSRIAAPVIPLSARPERQRRLVPAWMGVAAAALIMSTAGITYVLTARSLAPRQSRPAVVMQASGVTQPEGNSGSIQDPSSNLAGAPEQVEGGNSRNEGQRGGSSAQRSPTPATLASGDQGGPSPSDVVYGKEIELLQRIVGQRKAQLDSSTVAIIEKNLQIIDNAIQQSRAALAKDPASLLLSEQLTHALDKKVELLRTAAMLPAST